METGESFSTDLVDWTAAQGPRTAAAPEELRTVATWVPGKAAAQIQQVAATQGHVTGTAAAQAVEITAGQGQETVEARN